MRLISGKSDRWLHPIASPRNPKTMKQPLTTLATLLWLALAAGPAAFGQTSSGSSTAPSPPEPIVVLNPFEVTSQQDSGYRASNSITATGIGAAIKDIPSNISVITADNLNDRGVFDLRDAMRNLASVSSQNRDDGLSVRGFGAVVQQDGVVGGDAPVYDVNRIEVVRGPSSIFHGASRPGGVVNVIRNAPEFKWRTDLAAQEGSFGLHRYELGVTGPLWKDRVALRVYGADFRRQGEYEFQSRKEEYYRGAVQIRPFGNHKLQFDANFTRFDRDWHVMQADPVTHPAFVAAVQMGTVAPLTPQRTWLNADPRFGPNAPQGTIFATSLVYPRQFYNADGRMDNRESDLQSYNLTITPFSWLSVRARRTDVSGENEILEFNTFRPFAGNRPGQFLFRVNQVWSRGKSRLQDNRVEATATFKVFQTSHRLFLGGSAVRAGSTSRTLNGPSVVFDPFVDPVPNHRAAVLAANPAGFPAFADIAYDRNRSYYANDQIGLFKDRIRLLAGARMAEVKQINGKITKQTTPTFGGLAKVAPWLSVYANYGKVFEPNNLRDGAGNPVPPVTGLGAEFGAKTDAFDGRLSLTASIYRADRKNVARIDFSKQMETGIIPFYTLGGLERNEGFELEAIFSPIDPWQFILTYSHAWTHETIESTGEIRQVGVSLATVPDHQAALWQAYRFTTPKLKGLAIGGGVKWVKNVSALHPTWDITVGEPGYTKVDLFARYSTKLWKKDASLQVKFDNIFNERYHDHIYILAEPLTMVATLRLRF